MANGWFRWWHGTVTDPKFMWVSRHVTKCHGIVTCHGNIVTVWAALLEHASQEGERGSIDGFDAASIDCLLGVEDGTTQQIIEAFEAKGMIADGRLTGWEKRQPAREDAGNRASGAMSAAERKRLQRRRERTTDESREVTQCHDESREVTQCHDRVDKIRVNPLPSVGGAGGSEPADPESADLMLDASPSAPPADDSETRKKRGARLPDDWVLPKPWGQWALAEQPTWNAEHVRRVAESFRDFWVAKPGRDACKLDWEATWRNWVRKESPLRNSAPRTALAVSSPFAGCE